RPRLRRLRILKPFGESVDEHETGYIVRVGAGIKSADQTAVRMGDKHVGPASSAALSRACKSATASFAVVGCGTGSLRLGFSPTGVPGRSQAHTRVNFPTSLKTVGLDLSEMLQSSAEARKAPTNTTVGDPVPSHL